MRLGDANKTLPDRYTRTQDKLFIIIFFLSSLVRNGCMLDWLVTQAEGSMASFHLLSLILLRFHHKVQ
jgi:hypothetical protein